MPYPPIFLIHRCDITQIRPTGAVDRYGNAIQTSTKQAGIACRMTGGAATPGTDGNLCTARCTLSANTGIREDDQVETDAPGYSKKYWVNYISQIYEPTTSTISHTILELRETEERERA